MYIEAIVLYGDKMNEPCASCRSEPSTHAIVRKNNTPDSCASLNIYELCFGVRETLLLDANLVMIVIIEYTQANTVREQKLSSGTPQSGIHAKGEHVLILPQRLCK